MTETDMRGSFYLDCFIASDLEFPVNSYGPASFTHCLYMAGNLRPDSGVEKIEIGRTTRGMNPRLPPAKSPSTKEE